MIEPRKEAFRVNYVDELLEGLFIAQSEDVILDRHAGEWFGLNTLFPYPELIEKAEHTLMVATSKLDDPTLIDGLQKRVDAGVRIYLLLGRESDNELAIESLAGRCLIRTGVAQNGTLIIKNQATDTAQGIILSSGFADSGYWLRLTTTQREDYFRVFCHLFWELAFGENLLQGKKAQKAEDNPLGKIDLNHQDPLAEKLQNNLRLSWSGIGVASLSGILSQIDLDTLPQAPSGALLSELANMNEERALKLSQKVAHLALTDQPKLPQLVQGEDQQHWMLPQSVKVQEVNWCVRLTPAQCQEIIPLLERWQHQARWQFRQQVHVADIDTPIRFADQLDKEFQCQPQRMVELDSIRTHSFEEFMQGDVRDLASPQVYLQRDRLAREIDYRVAIHPPYCPEKADVDTLHQAWDNVKQSWLDRIVNLTAALKQEDGSQSRIGKRVRSALGSFFAGQSHSRREIEQELVELHSWDCSLDPASVREEKLTRLNQLADLIRQRQDRWVNKVDEVQQQQSWEQKRQSLKENMEVARAELKKRCKLTDEHQRSVTQTREKHQQQFMQQWLLLVDDIDTDKSSSSKDIDTMREFKKAQMMDWINKNNKQLPQKLKRSFRLFRDDVQGAEQKLARTIHELEQQQQKAQRAVERLNQELQNVGEHFIYLPRKEGTAELAKVLGNRTDSRAEPLDLKWPSDDPPQPGTYLRSLNNKRWLVITSEIQLTVAQVDAKRLNATICTEEMAHG